MSLWSMLQAVPTLEHKYSYLGFAAFLISIDIFDAAHNELDAYLHIRNEFIGVD